VLARKNFLNFMNLAIAAAMNGRNESDTRNYVQSWSSATNFTPVALKVTDGIDADVLGGYY
jgi:hypothetical protein